MGTDYKPPSVNETTAKQLQAMTQYGPGALAALTQSVQGLAPGQAASDFRLYNQYAPGYFQTGEALNDASAANATQRDLRTIAGGGRELATQALSLDQMANPEFYANRQAVGQGYQSLLGGMDPNKLSGAEMANAERGINRLNFNAGNPSNVGDATTTVANAGVFGDALNAKRSQFGAALSLFPGIQQGSQSGINAYQIAAGRGAQAGNNPSLGQYQQPQQMDANQFYGNLQQGLTETSNQRQGLLANRRSPIDFGTQVAGSVPDY